MMRYEQKNILQNRTEKNLLQELQRKWRRKNKESKWETKRKNISKGFLIRRIKNNKNGYSIEKTYLKTVKY